MPHSIEIDTDVYEQLQSMAEPFVDTPSAVLRRVLGLDDNRAVVAPKSSSATRASRPARPRRSKQARNPARQTKGRVGSETRPRAASGSLLPEEEYGLPLLIALAEAGGEGPSKDIIKAVGSKLADRLTELDREPLNSGVIRWENRVQFIRLKMIERGLMIRNSPRGIWAISDAGRQLVATTKSKKESKG